MTDATAVYTPADFVRDAERILDIHGPTPAGFDAIGDRLRNLGRQPGLITDEHLESLHGSGSSATILVESNDHHCALMLARFPAEAPTPVHDHNSWGVACVVRGRDRYLRWERHDDGADPHHADVRLAEERVLETGDVVWFGPPPHDIHSQQGIGDAAWELVFFGTNPNTRPRAYYDPESGYVEHAPATR